MSRPPCFDTVCERVCVRSYAATRIMSWIQEARPRTTSRIQWAEVHSGVANYAFIGSLACLHCYGTQSAFADPLSTGWIAAQDMTPLATEQQAPPSILGSLPTAPVLSPVQQNPSPSPDARACSSPLPPLALSPSIIHYRYPSTLTTTHTAHTLDYHQTAQYSFNVTTSHP